MLKDMNNSQIKEKIRECIEGIMERKIEEEEFQKSLSMIGINSIKFVKILIAIEEEFDYEFDEEILDFYRFEKLNEFIEIVINNLMENQGAQSGGECE